jgi:DNA-binding LacI/PurR family transcriptional regulator
MATIRDVASLAKVSVATVSRVLNKNGYVNETTEANVRKAMQQLNYKPNTIAQSLSSRKTKMLGLIVPDITNPFFPELARAVEDVAQIYGYTVILCNSDEKVEKEREYLDVLEQKYIDGIILASHTFEYHHLSEKIPVVVLDRSIDDNMPTVVSQNRQGAVMATSHLLEVGCKKIAHIRGPQETMTAQERYKGYLQVVQKQTWFQNDLVVDGDFEITKSLEATKELLQQHPDIDGIFAGNDLMAVGALKAARQLGRKVPEDIAIIGFDNILLTTMIETELSTIAQPIYDMGALATRMLLKKIENKPLPDTYHELEVTLVQRASTQRAKS